MADVFISYSRKDKAFIERLHAALESTGRDAWIDWEGIPPTAEWLSEIFAGIEAANAFIFAISPDSVASEICRLELNHAVTHNKKLVPVVVREVHADDVPEALRPINWILFRESDFFEDSLATLISALDTDLEWVRAHTHLLLRALEWDSKSRNNSLLLRGDDLVEAEEWLNRFAGKEPLPTGVQRDYVVASRQAATRRRRTTIAITSGVTAVTAILCIALGIAALIANRESGRAQTESSGRATQEAISEEQRGIAQSESDARATQQAIAEREARISASQALSAQALGSFEDRDFVTAYLKAVEGYLTYPTLEAERALFQVTQVPLPRVRVFANELYDVAASPDGKLLAVASLKSTGGVTLLDAETLEIQREFPVSSRFVKFSPDGTRLVTEAQEYPRLNDFQENAAVIWNVATGEPELELIGHTDEIRTASFSNDGQRIVTAGGDSQFLCDPNCDYTTRVWDARTGAILTELCCHQDYINVASFSPDGGHVITGGADKAMHIWDASSGALRATYEAGSSVETALFDSSGTRILVNTIAETFLLEADSLEIATLIRSTDGVWTGAYGPDGSFAKGAGDGSVTLLTSHGYLLTEFFGHNGSTRAVTFNPITNALITIGSDDRLQVWNTAYAQPTSVILERPEKYYDFLALSLGNTHHVLYTPDGTRIVTTVTSGGCFVTKCAGVQVWDIAQGTSLPAPWLEESPDARALATSTNGKYALTAAHCSPRGCSAPLSIWDLETFDQVARLLETADVELQGAAISPDASQIMTVETLTSGGLLRVWDVATEQEILRHEHESIGLPDSQAVNEYFFADRGYTASADYTLNQDGTMYASPSFIRDAQTGEILFEIEGCCYASFSADGSLLATGGDSSAHIWDTRTGQELAQFEHTEQVNSARFSPDGSRLVTASWDGWVKLWDVATGTEIASFRNQNLVEFATFSPDGQRVVSAGTNTLAFWIVSPEELLNRAIEQIEAAGLPVPTPSSS